jgi:NADPH:quinone reductase-like Zn-dependent oxidoreductase
MKAYRYEQYGGPEVLHLVDLPTPTPADDELRVRVMATSVNRTDSGFLTGLPRFARLIIGPFGPRAKTLGCEFAGVVDAIGAKVTRYRVGDRITGFNDWVFGGHGEYLITKESAAHACIPENMTFLEAAPILEGAHYALCDLRAARIGPGSRVLVYGATGAIGSAAIQLAKHMGAYVTAVCATAYVERIRGLGPDDVLDYMTDDLSTIGATYDLVFDSVGKRSFGTCKHMLTPKGLYISTELGPGAQNPFLALAAPFMSGRRVKFPLPSITQHDVEYLIDLAARGVFRPLIDRTVRFDQIPEAFAYVLTGMKVGNVVVNVTR